MPKILFNLENSMLRNLKMTLNLKQIQTLKVICMITSNDFK